MGVDSQIADDETEVKAKVYVNEKLVFNEEAMVKGDIPVDFTLPIKGGGTFAFEIRSDAGELKYDFADWLDLKLE